MQMEEYLKTARETLTKLDEAAEAFGSTIDSDPVLSKLPPGKRSKVKDLVADVPRRTNVVRNSLDTTEKTAVDITDLQHRLDSESDSLASTLSKLGDAMEDALRNAQDPNGSTAGESVKLLEEQAKRVAMALFPNAIEGIEDVNRTLWNFRIISSNYSRILNAEEAKTKDRMSDAQLATVRDNANNVQARFDAVNELLNQLTISRQGSAEEVQAVVHEAREALANAIKHARARDSETFKPFRDVLGDAEKLAKDIDGKFQKIRLPVFPSSDFIGAELGSILENNVTYDSLTGVQRMALLNISARLKSITSGDKNLLSPSFQIHIFEVFPDRIYFRAHQSFIETVKGLQEKGEFEKAPAGLHKFNEGSYKQKTSKKGNLQVSFKRIDAERYNVDADIDLYRSPLRHLFGEVLVNHLTGNLTDQFKVFAILLENALAPIPGFNVIRLT